MANVKPYPHYEINVKDNSIYVPITVDDLPIHRPVYPMKCQKGPIGIPIWCSTYSQAKAIFGAETFNYLNEDYFSRSAFFLYNTLQNNGAFIVRLADDTASTASLVLELSVEAVDVEQYEKDANGNWVVDSNGDPVSQDPVVEEPGTQLTWKVRVLESDEDYDSLEPVTVGDVTTYPMIGFLASSSGLWGNDVGFSLYYNTDENETDQIDRVGGVFYTLAPIQKDYGFSTTTPIRDLYTSTFNSFIMKPNVIDAATDTPVSVADVLERTYPEGYELPYNVHVYNDNFETVGDICRALEVNRTDDLTSGWLVNLVSARDFDNKPYDHIVITSETGDATLVEGINYYLLGGTDGTLDKTTIEGLIVNFLSGSINPDLSDKPRYPITHMFDTGFALTTKYAMLDFLNYRDDVKVILSTQDCDISINSKLEDESTGSALRSRALLMRESIVMGTGCCRAEIFQQAGKPVNTNYNQWIPAGTFWSAMKYAEYQNLGYLNKEPKGLPNSDVSLFKEVSWTPSTEDLKARSWDTGLNYFQYYTMKNLHYAGVRTVYNYDTSVLVDTTFTDAIVYSKHEIRQSWAKFASLTMANAELQTRVRADLIDRLGTLYNGKYVFDVTVYQTEEEARLGFVQHVLVDITAPAGKRVWQVDIVCNREDFNG